MESEKDVEAPSFSEEVTMQLISFGFTDDQIRAAAATIGGRRPEVDAIADWIFNNPNPAAPPAHAGGLDPESIAMVCSMGFDAGAAERALKACNNNIELAVNWLMEGMDPGAGMAETSAEPPVAARNSPGLFDICGAIVHLGSNARSGHYVTYILKQNKWYLYNDTVVSEFVEEPDLKLGYMFLYRRRT
eukprot:Protomagalhaensia_wolfi_Nauph_80__561@NODE_1318_length_1591_cov_3_777706_g1019_i0_p1_GENE_NODE_1318_length_1591_cov_3_777706_g1019_i0NODE_1318_length_1591_cov_3_777706_g1019_i0_p1_ORF_typecomplete_len189_score38_64UBA/PF00627_31/0_24UBA/PF00627_31/5_7e13UCH/PF00443_29/1_2e12UCH_1/PF13423_6/0_00059UBA_4/PF14555_6/0_012UBA_4/PF14555_6/9_8e03CUE/PF02845_16/0_037CUE/PF02845_16/7_3e03RuvA_C/PF07499_13/0_59RuvA_C/PF07499_13/2e02UBA_3/PF09288_10/1_5e03UBA_3/PF09288_10/1_7UBA_3/PF09288_10/2_7e03_NODE_13